MKSPNKEILSTWAKIALALLPKAMQLTNGRIANAANMKKELTEASETLLTYITEQRTAIQLNLKQQPKENQLAIKTKLSKSIKETLTHILNEKQSSVGKGIVTLGAASLIGAGIITGYVFFWMSNLSSLHYACGLMSGFAFLSLLVTIGAAISGYCNILDHQWARKLSRNPTHAINSADDFKTIKKALTDCVTNEDTNTIDKELKTTILTELNKWADWSPKRTQVNQSNWNTLPVILPLL